MTRRIGALQGYCSHGNLILAGPCEKCKEEEKAAWAQGIYDYTACRQEQVSFVEALGQYIIDAFNQRIDSIGGVFPVFTGTKKQLQQGKVEFELQRSWKDMYGDGPPGKIVVQIKLKHTKPFWKRIWDN